MKKNPRAILVSGRTLSRHILTEYLKSVYLVAFPTLELDMAALDLAFGQQVAAVLAVEEPVFQALNFLFDVLAELAHG
jgi:hypothetical protein